MPITVLLADDSEVVRNVIAGVLKSDPEIELVAECNSFARTMLLARTLRPQVIVLDVHMGDEHIVSREQLKSELASSRVVAISIWTDHETRTLAETMGADALLDKTNLATDLIPAIRGLPGQ